MKKHNASRVPQSNYTFYQPPSNHQSVREQPPTDKVILKTEFLRIREYGIKKFDTQNQIDHINFLHMDGHSDGFRINCGNKVSVGILETLNCRVEGFNSVKYGDDLHIYPVAENGATNRNCNGWNIVVENLVSNETTIFDPNGYNPHQQLGEEGFRVYAKVRINEANRGVLIKELKKVNLEIKSGEKLSVSVSVRYDALLPINGDNEYTLIDINYQESSYDFKIVLEPQSSINCKLLIMKDVESKKAFYFPNFKFRNDENDELFITPNQGKLIVTQKKGKETIEIFPESCQELNESYHSPSAEDISKIEYDTIIADHRKINKDFTPTMSFEEFVTLKKFILSKQNVSLNLKSYEKLLTDVKVKEDVKAIFDKTPFAYEVYNDEQKIAEPVKVQVEPEIIIIDNDYNQGISNSNKPDPKTSIMSLEVKAEMMQDVSKTPFGVERQEFATTHSNDVGNYLDMVTYPVETTVTGINNFMHIDYINN